MECWQHSADRNFVYDLAQDIILNMVKAGPSGSPATLTRYAHEVAEETLKRRVAERQKRPPWAKQEKESA